MQRTTRRPTVGRLFFFLTAILLTVGVWRSAQSGFAWWSRSDRLGAITDIALWRGDPLVARLNRHTVEPAAAASTVGHAFPRPLQLTPDRRGGFYVVGLLSSRVGRLDAGGGFSSTSFSPALFVTGLLAEPDGVWIVGYRRARADSRRKEVFYFPEYSRYQWFLDKSFGELRPGRHRLSGAAWQYDNEFWHEESGDDWFVLRHEQRLLVVNPLAESVNCVDAGDGRIVWRRETGPRPAAALLWRDRLVVLSSLVGVVEAFRANDGVNLWRFPVGPGVTDMAPFGDRLVLADWAGDRVIEFDPDALRVTREQRLPGAPRALAADGEALWVGLEATQQLVRLNRDLVEEERRPTAEGVGP